MEGADTKTGQLLSRLWVSAKSPSTGALLPNFRITAAGGLPKGARQSTAYDGLQIVHWPCFNRLYEISHENISGKRAASEGAGLNGLSYLASTKPLPSGPGVGHLGAVSDLHDAE